MSRQLAISSALSIFAMVACVLIATPNSLPGNDTGAKAQASAPVLEGVIAALPLISD